MSYSEYIAKKHAAFKTDPKIIGRFMEEGLHVVVTGIDKIIEGEVNEVYDVSTQKGNYIVRISHQGSGSFETEKMAIDLARSKGVPAPKVIMVKNIKIGTETHEICIEEKVDGEPLSKLMEGISTTALKKIFIQAGSIISSIHECVLPQKTDWKNFISGKIKNKNHILQIASEIGIPKTKINTILDRINNRLFLLADCKLSMLHWDFSPKHLLIKGGKITGIIDFENAKNGDPLFDLAWLNFFYGEDVPLGWLQEGYKNKQIFKDNYEEKMSLYCDFLCLEFLQYYYSENNNSGLEFIKNKILAGD